MGTIKLPTGFDGRYQDPSDPFGGYGQYNSKTDNWTLAVQDAATVEKLGDPFGAGLVEQVTKLAQQNDKLAQQAAADNQRAAQNALSGYTRAVEAETKLIAEKNRATQTAAAKLLADTIARAEKQAAEAQKRAELEAKKKAEEAEKEAKRKAKEAEEATKAKTLGDIPQEMRDQILKDFDKSGAKGNDWDLAHTASSLNAMKNTALILWRQLSEHSLTSKMKMLKHTWTQSTAAKNLLNLKLVF